MLTRRQVVATVSAMNSHDIWKFYISPTNTVATSDNSIDAFTLSELEAFDKDYGVTTGDKVDEAMNCCVLYINTKTSLHVL